METEMLVESINVEKAMWRCWTWENGSVYTGGEGNIQILDHFKAPFFFLKNKSVRWEMMTADFILCRSRSFRFLPKGADRNETHTHTQKKVPVRLTTNRFLAKVPKVKSSTKEIWMC